MKILCANTATITTPQGGGHHRHIRIIMKLNLYKNLMNTVCTNPHDPGLYPTIPTKSTVALWDQIKNQHDEGQRIYENTGKMDEALNNQVIDAVKEIYLKESKNKYTGFLRVTFQDLL